MQKLLWDKIVIGGFVIFGSFGIFVGKDGLKNNSTERPVSSVYSMGWPTAHADGGNTDYSPVFGEKNIMLAWEREFDGTINLGPTSDSNGQVYVTNNGEGCHLHALDSQAGQTRWCTDEVNRFAVASSALLDNDGHLFLADDEAMHAFDNSGNLLWETPIEGFPFSAQFTQTGHLIFITNIGWIYVLDRFSGNHILDPVSLAPSISYSANTNVRACMRGTGDCPCANTPAFDQHTGKFFFTFWEQGAKQADLVAMQYSETPAPAIKPLWTNGSLSGGSASSPVLSADGSRVYVNDNNGNLHAIEATTGKNIWQFSIGYNPGGSQSISPEGLILPAGGNNSPLMCIADRGNRAELTWHNDSLLNRGVATQCAGNLAYVTVKTKGFENDLVVVDVATGKVTNREHLPGTTIFTVGTTIGADGTIYIPAINGRLFAFKQEKLID